jgi:GAF domain-containing protein
MLAAARRAEVLQDMLRRIRQETSVGRGLQVALRALIGAMTADGAALIDESDNPVQTGLESAAVKEALNALAQRDIIGDSAEDHTADGHAVLLWRVPTRLGGAAGLAVWRRKPSVWQESERQLVESAGAILALILEHQAVEREMARQSRTDPLTGLLNRRGFLEELPRHIDRLEREQSSGTLVLVDLDGLRAVNKRLGLPTGDRVLVALGKILRAGGPADGPDSAPGRRRLCAMAEWRGSHDRRGTGGGMAESGAGAAGGCDRGRDSAADIVDWYCGTAGRQ